MSLKPNTTLPPDLNESSPSKNNKPKWLKKLEKESWQAELGISGAAIFATFQIPELFDWLEARLLLSLQDYALYYWDMILPMFIFAGFVLTGIFIFHLFIRALWIGLVGLNSVFPDGFTANERFSKDFQRKLIADYGDIDGYIQELDRLGSGIFGVGFGFVLAFANMAILGSVLIGVATLLHQLPPNLQWLEYIIGGIVIFTIILSFLTTLSHDRRFHNHPLALRYQYPVTKVIGQLMMPLNNRYINTTINLISFHTYSSKSATKTMLIMGIVGFLMGFVLGASGNFKYIDKARYHAAAQDSTQIMPTAYFTNYYEGVFIHPVLPTLNFESDRQFSAWIPLPKRELEYLEKDCLAPEVDDDLPKTERRIKERQRQLVCARSYLELKINGQVQNKYSIKSEYIENEAGKQFGVRVTIMAPNFNLGENLFTVTSKYFHPDTKALRKAHIPFYYRPVN